LQVDRASVRSGPLGTSETLVGGDPWVPMSIRRSLAMVRVVITSVDVVSRLEVALVYIPIQQSEG
jgi:hypothetical protein